MWQTASDLSIPSKSTTYYNDKAIIEISRDQINFLKSAASSDPLKRARLCLHHGNEDRVHEMLIVMHRDTYVRPHRHTDKSESFHIIDGELDIIFFDDHGYEKQTVRMGIQQGDMTMIYRLANDQWHMVIPRSDYVIFHETTTGPFIADQTEFASWSPEETNEAAVIDFLNQFNRA